MAKKNRGDPTEVRHNGLTDTIIGEGSVADGTLQAKSSVRVDGLLTGELVCSDSVVVGSSGQVEANLKAKNAVVAGKFMGSLDVSERLHLQPQCVVQGDVKTKSLIVEEGAILKANCDSGGELPVSQDSKRGVESPRLEEERKLGELKK